ncbi:agarase [Agaribacterium haliotis]|uniref:agarase n=1 Tax=Agaribacterium haliotis TaxID=2013869 RepID=UPI000BB556F8|nr:agarase [Agaribacterium haliotis]
MASFSMQSCLRGAIGGGIVALSLMACSSNDSDKPKPTPSSSPSTVPSPSPSPSAEPATSVDINFDMRHSVGGHYEFDRQKYITIHASHIENDWVGGDDASLGAENKDPDLVINFSEDNDVYFGRDTGGFSWQLRNIMQDSSRAGFVDESSAMSRGAQQKANYSNNNTKKFVQGRAVEHRAQDIIVGTQQHPFWPEGTLISSLVDNDWAFSENDTSAEPLGTATGHYIGQYLANFFKQDNNSASETGMPKATWVEVMNEPLYDLVTDREGLDNQVEPDTIFEYHNAVASEVQKSNPGLPVGGYTVAFPDFDRDNFQRWEERDKRFIDIAGANMDFFSVHLYDFPCFNNSERYRKGSNVEATLDMLEAYSLIELNEVKPLVISEYGAAIHCMFNQGWNAERNTLQMRAINSLLMAFLERPDVVAKTIPFIVVKAEWGREGEIPYGPRLMVQGKERGDSDSGEQWVYSDLVLFYQLWAEVNGTRVDSKTTDLDVLSDVYVDGDTAYIILNNLVFDDKEIALNQYGLNGNTITAVNIKHLTTSDDQWQASSIIESNSATLPESVTLGAEATMIIKVSFASELAIDQQSNESKYYADSYKQAISANSAIEFNINDVETGSTGEAVLRLGVGRDHGRSLQPNIALNGTVVDNSGIDYRGYDQQRGSSMTGRDNFFGILELSVPYDLLQQNNTLSVSFEDDGGYVSSAALQVFEQSRQATRSN